MKKGRVGLEPTRWCLTNSCSAAELPTQSKVPCGNRTRLSSLEGWRLCRSAKGTCHSLRRKPWDSNPQSRFSGHLLSSGVQLPWLQPSSSLSLGGKPCFQPDDFHSSSCGNRNRTCVVTVNSRLPVPARTPPQCFSVSVVGFEPTVSCSQGTRIPKLSHTLIIIPS